jgi:hypothetical protein
MKTFLVIFNLIAFWASLSVININSDVFSMAIIWGFFVFVMFFMNAFLYGAYIGIKRLF